MISSKYALTEVPNATKNEFKVFIYIHQRIVNCVLDCRGTRKTAIILIIL